MSHSPRKLVTFACAAALIAGWSFWQWKDTRAIASQNDEVFSLPSADLLEVNTKEIPNRVGAYSKIATLRGTRQIPPDHRGAVEYLGRALAIEPLRSDLWLRLSRHLLFLREKDKARAALLRSDELDPVYPEQRMEAAKLWALLGDKPHAIKLMTRIAALDSTARFDAIPTLHLLSVPSDELFTLIGGEKLPMQDVLDILPSLKTSDATVMEKLWRKIPATYRDDPDFANAAAAIYSSPVVYTVATQLWEKSSKTVTRNPIGSDGLVVFLDDPAMTRNVLNDSFYYGWQEFPRTTWVRADWDGARGEEKDVATVRMTFTGSGAPTMQRDFEWVFYRLPLPPTQKALMVSMEVFPNPASESICRIGARINGRGVGGTKTEWSREEWQTLSVVIPPSAETRLVELVFQRNRRGTGADASSKVYITGFKISEAAAPPAEAP